MEYMKALVKTAPDHAEIQKIPIPECGSGEVLVRVRSAALCGTDLHILAWNSWAQNSGIKFPFILGHECSGDIVATGDESGNSLKVGDKVAVETHVPCGRCDQCLNGEQHICNNLRIFGVHMNGCFAEYSVVPALCARKIPDAVTYDIGSMMEPIGTSFRAVQEAQVAGLSVLVVGCGPIGLFAVASASTLGANRIIAADVSSQRLEIAGEMGADIIIDPLREDILQNILNQTNGYGVDVIIEASGNSSALKQSFQLLRKGGTIAMVGLPEQPVELEIGRDIVFKEAKIMGIHGRRMFGTWSKVERLLKAGKLYVEPAITHRFSLDGWQEGVQLAKSGHGCKIIFQP